MTLRTLCRSRELVCPLLCRSRHFAIRHLLDVLDKSVKLYIIIVARLRNACRDAQAVGTAVQDFVYRLLGQLLDGSR